MFKLIQAIGVFHNKIMFQLKNFLPKLILDKIILKDSVLVAVALLVIVVTAVLIFGGNSVPFGRVTQNATDYLNKNVLQNGQTAKLLESSKESGLIKMKMEIGGQNYDMYATKDGKLLFLQGILLNPESAKETTKNQDDGTPSEEKPK